MLTPARIITLLLVLGSAVAFGPFTPVATQNGAQNGGGLTMRVGTKDLIRRQRFNKILQSVQPNPTKENVEAVIVSDGTSALIEKCNWKLRKSMIRKVTNQANQFGIQVSPKFGKPMSREERVLQERETGEANKAKKMAAAKLLVEEAAKKAEAKAEKKAAKEAKAAEEAKLKEEQEAKAKLEREAAEAKAAEEAKLKAEKEAAESKAAEEAKLKAEQEAKAAKEAKMKAEQEAKAAEEAKLKAEAQAKATEEAKMKVEVNTTEEVADSDPIQTKVDDAAPVEEETVVVVEKEEIKA